MEGYYDHHATVALARPVTLIGFLDGLHRHMGHRLASRTGLPLIDVERWVEHQAGQSLWDLVHTQGETMLRQLERELLRKALASQPCGVVVLGDGALLHPANLEEVRAHSTLIYLRLDLANAYWRLRGWQQERGRMWHPFLPHPLESIDQLRPAYEQRRPGFEQAHHTLDLAGKNAEEILRQLLNLLPEAQPAP